MINKENYEGYLMRYADGELGVAGTAEVEAFLNEHPDLHEELEIITAPSLRVTPPLTTMPGKERLLHEVAVAEPHRHTMRWISIAATVTLFVVTFSVTHVMLHQDGGPVVALRHDTVTVSVSDTLLPDSLFIRPEKRLSVYLADAATQSLPQSETKDEEPAIDNDIFKYDTLLQFDYDLVPVESFAENKAKPTTGKAKLVGGRVIVVETDQLVDIMPKRDPSTLRPDISRGYIVENAMLATEEKKGLIGSVIDLIAGSLQRRTQDSDTLLAYNEE